MVHKAEHTPDAMSVISHLSWVVVGAFAAEGDVIMFPAKGVAATLWAISR